MNKKLRALLASVQPGSHRSDGQIERVCTIWRALCLNGHRTRSCANAGFPNTPQFASSFVAAVPSEALGDLLPLSSTKRQSLSAQGGVEGYAVGNTVFSSDTEGAHSSEHRSWIEDGMIHALICGPSIFRRP